jgi:ubiquinone/menaquinone biosynthesis C-methylase UbiE
MSFDALAPHYRWMEFILAGQKLQRCRAAFLDAIPIPQSILLLGEGPGRALIECCRRFRSARITCVDASAAMHAQARRRLERSCPAHDQVDYVRANVLGWTPPSSEAYDLIVTNFFLDCFRPEQLERITRVISAASAINANWLVADFQMAATGLPRIRSKIILWQMYSFFRIAARLPAQKLTPPGTFLRNAGFILKRSIQADWGLLHSDWWQRSA